MQPQCRGAAKTHEQFGGKRTEGPRPKGTRGAIDRFPRENRNTPCEREPPETLKADSPKYVHDSTVQTSSCFAESVCHQSMFDPTSGILLVEFQRIVDPDFYPDRSFRILVPKSLLFLNLSPDKNKLFSRCLILRR